MKKILQAASFLALLQLLPGCQTRTQQVASRWCPGHGCVPSTHEFTEDCVNNAPVATPGAPIQTCPSQSK
jgi:hypothetical protein